jgi:hypothetical protein
MGDLAGSSMTNEGIGGFGITDNGMASEFEKKDEPVVTNYGLIFNDVNNSPFLGVI